MLGIGGIGAALALVELLGTAGAVAGVALMIRCTILTAPRRPGRTTRSQLVGADRGGDRLAIVGVPLELALEAPAACSPRSAAAW